MNGVLARSWTWTIALLSVVFVCAPGANAWAGGCHVADRPELGTHLAQELLAEGVPPAAGFEPVPPILDHPPCQGETPRAGGQTDPVAGPGLAVGIQTLTAAAARIHAGEPPLDRPTTTRHRLDRPPRCPPVG